MVALGVRLRARVFIVIRPDSIGQAFNAPLKLPVHQVQYPPCIQREKESGSGPKLPNPVVSGPGIQYPDITKEGKSEAWPY